MFVSPVPAGYRSLTPYLIVDGAGRALSWYPEAFGARQPMRLSDPEGRIGHAGRASVASRSAVIDQ